MQVNQADIQEIADGALRVIAEYDQHGVEMIYERDDITTDEQVVEDVHENLILEEIGVDYLERIFKVGELDSMIYRFEEAVCIHYFEGDYRGALISVDTNSNVDLEGVVNVCEQA